MADSIDRLLLVLEKHYAGQWGWGPRQIEWALRSRPDGEEIAVKRLRELETDG